MNQLRIEDVLEGTIGCRWTLYVDGASRNNPGPAGAGVYILKDDLPFIQKSYFLGNKTNNQAEYYALLLGLFLLASYVKAHDKLSIFSDSQLLVLQLKEAYKVKHPELKPLYMCARAFLSTTNYEICHVLRHENKVADTLANEGIKRRTPLPIDFENFCNRVTGN